MTAPAKKSLSQGHFSNTDDCKHSELFGGGTVCLTTMPLNAQENSAPSLILALACYLLEPRKIPEPTEARLSLSSVGLSVSDALYQLWYHVINHLLRVFPGICRLQSHHHVQITQCSVELRLNSSIIIYNRVNQKQHLLAPSPVCA